MFYTIAKIAGFFTQPSSLILVGLLMGFVLLYSRHGRAGRLLIGGSLVAYFIFGLSPVPHLLTVPLEQRFSRPDEAELAKGIDGILLLGGGIDSTVSLARQAVALNEAGERVVETLMLANRFPKVPVVITGGANTVFYDGLDDGTVIKRLFTALVKKPQRLIIERKAKNTWQNAYLSRKLLGEAAQGRWLLVTSAMHMPRAVGCFRKVGFEVVPWPVDYRTRGWQDAWRFFNRPAEGLYRSDHVFREWVGLIGYWLTGRSSALFPG